MFRNEIGKLRKIFGSRDIIFIGENKYFKINFSRIEDKDAKKLAMKFKLFIIKICKGEEFDLEDIDTTADTDSSEVIRAKIVDKIETSKGIDLTAKVAIATQTMAIRNDNELTPNMSVKQIASAIKSNNVKIDKVKTNVEKDQDKPVTSKLTKSLPEKDLSIDAKINTDKDLEKLATTIVAASDTTTSEDDALNYMDNDEIKRILMDLDSAEENDGVIISDERKARMSELDKKVMDNNIKGKTVKDILEAEPLEIPTIDIKVSSPNEEEWKNLKYINFDKTYNLEKDIINAFKAFIFFALYDITSLK